MEYVHAPCAMTDAPLPPRGPWRLLLVLTRPWLPALALAMGLVIVERLMALLLPLSVRFIVDDVIGRAQAQWLPPLAIVLVAASAIRAGSAYWSGRVIATTTQALVTRLREIVQERIGRLPLAFYEAGSTGALVARVMVDVESVRHMVERRVMELLGSAVSAVVAVIALFWLNPWLTACLVPIVPLFRYVCARAAPRMVRAQSERARRLADLAGRVTESFAGVRVVKTYCGEAREAAVFAAASRRLAESALVADRAWLALSLFTTLLMGTTMALVTYVGAWQVLSGAMTLGELLTYAALLTLVADPLSQVLALSSRIAETVAGLERVQEVLREPPEDANPRRVLPAPPTFDALRFSHVHFAYTPGIPVLTDISFVARRGTITALVGPSGAGKSTIAMMIGGFHHPPVGTISVDDVDLSCVRLHAYRSHVAIVLQETFLFSGTVRENVAFARPDATEADILDACRVARVDEFVQRLEGRYETVVGERGVFLSGGQRQRIAIARAILARPRLLLLDEATSSLDSESEIAIHAALDRVTRRCITLIIAHRLSTIRHADQILVLDAGRIVERGSHEELVQADGWYGRTYRAQHLGNLERSGSSEDWNCSAGDAPGDRHDQVGIDVGARR